jgi:hypothetical protein
MTCGRAPVDARSFQHPYGGRIALHGKDAATAERRNTAPVAFHKRQTFAGDWGARETGTENLRRLNSVHVSAHVIYTMPAREALDLFVEPWSISGRPRFCCNSRILSEAIGPA